MSSLKIERQPTHGNNLSVLDALERKSTVSINKREKLNSSTRMSVANDSEKTSNRRTRRT